AGALIVAFAVVSSISPAAPAHKRGAPASRPPTNLAGPAATPQQPPSAPPIGDPRRHKQAPSNAELAYQEGNAFSGKMWWSEALASYREAIRLDSRYREDPRLINNMIGALMSSSFHNKGARFLRDEIGPPAVPLLEAAAQRAESATTRKHAAEVLRSMPAPSRP